MTGPEGERGLVRYFCTAGNGMEHFLVDEVKRKLAAEDVCQLQGKVLFSSRLGAAAARRLKAAERLFVLVKHDSPVELPAHAGPGRAASELQSRLLADRDQWTGAVMTWRRLQGDSEGRTTAANASAAALGVTRKREEAREEDGLGEEEQEEKCDELRRAEPRSCGQSGAGTLGGKRKRDYEEDLKHEGQQRASRREEKEEKEEARVVVKISRQKEKDGIPSEPDLCCRGTVCDLGVESSSGMADGVTETEHGGGDETPRQSGGPGAPSPPRVSFRISCKCTGSLSRRLGVQEISRVMAAGLSRLLGWKADLKDPQLEVNVYLSDDHCLLGIPLTRLPLANRSYIKTTGLRSTVAWAMASLARIQPGFLVVDPMCGVGTILIEAAQEHEDACFVGVDIDDGQLRRASENVAFAALGNRMHLLKASSLGMPLPSASVDAVVCDLPFGRKFGTKTNMAANLPLILTEMERVLRVGGTLVLLLSPQLSCLLNKVLAQRAAGPASDQEAEPQTGIQSCQFSSLFPSNQQAPGLRGPQSSPAQERDAPTGLQHGVPEPLSSLTHRATLRVGLGAIDGLIHTYVKK